ncbi:MAG: sigma-E processing peptidase SpoIIGA [Clostridia bacterium]|nr:sigma-E processing peptidase SpoIIGA [Clostridia bacterium]
MDFITIWISAILSSRQRSALRMSVASALGAVYGVLSVILQVNGAFTYISAFFVSIIMCIISFGLCGGLFSLLKQSILIWGCGALLGGTMTALLRLFGNTQIITKNGGNVFSLYAAITTVLVYITVRIVCNNKNKSSVTVKVTHRNKEISFSALCDSGNLLRDPLGGDPVIPVSYRIVSKLCGQKLCTALMSVDSSILESSHISFRLIPYKRDGITGIEGGFIPDSVTVISGKKKKNVRCVLSPRKCEKDYFAGHAATLPTSLLP